MPLSHLDRQTLKLVAATVASILLHLLLARMVLVNASSELARFEAAIDAYEDTPGIAVDLMGLAETNDLKSSPTPLEQMFKDLEAQDEGYLSEPSLEPTSPRQTLADVLGPEQDAPKAATKPADTGQVKTNAPSKARNDLWEAIRPCWQRLKPAKATAVRLSLSFSPLGNLSKPPTILRPQNTPATDIMLRSESAAITAVAQCGPYLMAYGQQNIEVGFTP